MTPTATTSEIKDSLLETVGETPLVRLSRIAHGCAPQIVFFEHKQHVPLQRRPHMGDESGGHVGVRVNPRARCQTLGV